MTEKLKKYKKLNKKEKEKFVEELIDEIEVQDKMIKLYEEETKLLRKAYEIASLNPTASYPILPAWMGGL